MQRDAQFDDLKMTEAMNRLLRAKNRHNILSMVLYLAVRWFLLYVAALAVTAHSFLGVLAISGAMLGLMLFRIFFMALVERSVMDSAA